MNYYVKKSNYFIYIIFFINYNISYYRQFENAIRNYTGEDPLQNWFQYILWVEQVFPKHGNLVNLLEDCISKFEYDKKYSDDRRLLKLIIKYVGV